jgi:hypothetical protein
MIGRFLAMISAAVVILDACDSTGVCEHIYQDPVLTMVRVDGGNSGPLTSVTIFDVVVSGSPLADLSSLTTPPAFGVTRVNGELRCALSCGFGVVEGQYEFTVKAPGYRDQRVTAMASYPHFEGGCPSRNSGSTEISVALDPAAP